MNKITTSILIVLALVFIEACTTTQSTTKEEAPKSEEIVPTKPGIPAGQISFKAANDMYKAFGTFKKWEFSSFTMAGNSIESIETQLQVNMNSVEEKSPKLTEHLKQSDFFYVERYPTSTITIKNVKAMGGNQFSAQAVVNMKGAEDISHVEFEVTNKNPLTIKGSLGIDRLAFDLGADNKGIGQEVTVMFDTPLPKK